MHSTKITNSIKRLISLALCITMVVCMLPMLEKKAEAATGYDTGYKIGMGGSGAILAHGIDASSWQGTGLDFQNIKNAGYSFVILRAGTSYGKDRCFEEYYANAKAAGLNVGCYFYSYALNGETAKKEACDVLSWIQGKTFEYPVYFDFEDPTQMNLSGTVSAQICRGFMDVMRDNGYLAGLYSLSWVLSQSWVTSSGIRGTYEGWVAHVYSDANNTGITSGQFNIYKDSYSSVYGMHQYSFTTYINGAGPFDANVSYKDYPSIVKQYGFNGYGLSKIDFAAFDSLVYRDRHEDLKDLTEEELRYHWVNHGMKEGRASSAILDLKYYVENNPDLKDAFGTDYVAAYRHFVTKGYKEHRKSSPVFDGQYYCDNNPDVAEHYKENYIIHYIDNGMKEGRRASLTFDVDYYLFIRPDVAKAWPDDLVMATRHFAGHGIKEGRIGYDKTNPTISSVTVSNVTDKGYTVTCKVTDDWEISNVSFPSWAINDVKEDLSNDVLEQFEGTKNGDTYSFNVKTSSLGASNGTFATHIYATDKGGNTTVHKIDNVVVNPYATKITLTSSSKYSINDKLLKNVNLSTTVKNLVSQFENDNLKVMDKNGKELGSSDTVGTGCVINLYQDGKVVDSVTVVILGDVDGNKVIDTTDYMKIKTAFLGNLTLTAAEKAAADIDGNGHIDSTDYLRIKLHFLGQYDIFA